MSRNRWDVVLDGNNYRLARGEQQPYVRGFAHDAVEEKELFNPFLRGTMQSRGDFRSFRQTDWSGGQTWFLPTLPNSGGDTYYASSLMDAWSKPGNLVPLNQFTETADANLPFGGNIVRGEDGNWQLITDDTYTTDKLVEQWSAAADAFASAGSFVSGIASANHFSAKQVYDPSDQFTVAIGQGTTININSQELGKFDVEGATGSTVSSTEGHAAGANIFYWDGKVMVYDGDNIRELNSGKTAYEATAVTDDGLGYDVFMARTGVADGAAIGAISIGNNVVHHGAMNLAIVSDRGVFYVKHVNGERGIEARLFQVEVTETGTYIRSPIGRLPSGMAVLNLSWHLDSLLMIVTPDTWLLKENLSATGYLETQLWHYTQGSIGAIGTFEKMTGAGTPAESPYTFPFSKGAVQYISSHDKLWAYDAIRGGVHQVHQFSTDVVGGLWGGFEDEDSAGDLTTVFVGLNQYHQQKGRYSADPKTGSWAAGSYTLESNYFDFGVPLETKTLRSVHTLFEAGSANETYYIDVEADDAGSWTTVATITCDNGGSVVDTDLTGNAITGNRFRYRIRLQVDSGTNMPEFRGLEFKAVTGEKRSTWTLTLDGTEITNVANVKQRPQDVYDQLVATAEKDGIVSFTDNFGKIEEDGTAIDVRVDQALLLQNTEGESIIQVQLTKVDI